MKKSLILFIALLISTASRSYSQNVYNVHSGSYEPDPVKATTEIMVERTTGGIPCNILTFWANDDNGSIIEYSLTGSVISATGITYPTPSYIRGLSYANNTAGPTGFSPTFYCMNDDTLLRYNGSSWQIAFVEPGLNSANSGGNGDHICFAGYIGTTPAPATRVYHYSPSTGVDTIYITPAGKYITIADQAVDDNGNCYFMTGVTSSLADSLFIVSPSGIVLNAFSLPLNTSNAYGSFIIGNTFYIGLGSFNAVYPNSLVPINITSTSAAIGTPISFPGSNGYSDLESCNQGLPLGLHEELAVKNVITAYPNPATGVVNITFPDVLIKSECELQLTNLAGQVVRNYKLKPMQNRLIINLENLQSGMYIVKFQDSDRLYTGKILVY